MKKTLLVLAFMVLFSSNLFSQTQIISSKFTKPFFSLEAGFGYTLPMFDLSGSSIKEFYDFKNYATSSGYIGNIKLGFTVANFKSTQLRIKWTIGYARFFGSDYYAYNVPKVTPGWPKINYVSPTAVSGNSSINFHQPYTAAGLDYVVYTDSKRTSLFTFGWDFTVSGMWGIVTDQQTNLPEEYNNITSAVRFGVGVNTDYTYRATEFMGLNAGVRFQFTNLFGKTSSLVSEDRDIPFNDGEDLSINPNLKSRNTGFLGFHGGVVFYFGGKK